MKTVIYDFLYGNIKPNFGNKAVLLYTDTDSFILRIETDDFYEFIKQNIDRFDTSNYKLDNKLNIPITKNQCLGKRKMNFLLMLLLAFMAQAYYIRSLNSDMKNAKGVKKKVIEKELSGEDYKNLAEYEGEVFRKIKLPYVNMMIKVSLYQIHREHYPVGLMIL